MFRGMAVGIIETVPGVSGSTVAIVLGIYDQLIYNLSLLTTKKRREAYPFLFVFGIGLVLGFILSLLLIDFFLTNFRTPTLSLFMGIVVGLIPFLWREAIILGRGRLSAKHYILTFTFLSIVVIGQLFAGFDTWNLYELSLVDYLFFIVAGFIASTALVLPGISGALILTILGIYDLAKDSLLSFYMPVVLPLGFGVILGILMSSRFIRYLLKNYPAETYSAIVGLVLGSIFAILSNMDKASSFPVIVASGLTFLLGLLFSVILKRS